MIVGSFNIHQDGDNVKTSHFWARSESTEDEEKIAKLIDAAIREVALMAIQRTKNGYMVEHDNIRTAVKRIVKQHLK